MHDDRSSQKIKVEGYEVTFLTFAFLILCDFTGVVLTRRFKLLSFSLIHTVIMCPYRCIAYDAAIAGHARGCRTTLAG